MNERGFAGRVTDSGEELDAVWTPEGDSIVFVATTDRNAAAYAHGQHVAVQDCRERRRAGATNNRQRQLSPVRCFVPTARRYTRFSTIETDGKVYNLDRLAKFSWPTWVSTAGQSYSPQDFDRSVGTSALTPDSKSIYLTG